MILNTLQSTSFRFVVTHDFDMVYAAIDNSLKDIVAPDGMIDCDKHLSKIIEIF